MAGLYCEKSPISYTLVEEEEDKQQLCFSGDMVVETPNGLKEMRELELGDWVLVDDDQTSNYQPVLMWIHRIEDQWAEFYRIETSNGQFIEATGHHALFQSDCLTSTTKFTYAKDIRPGNCLVVQNADMETNHAIVVNATVIRKKGIYAPLTASGTIVVNGILASCYSDLLLGGIHQSFFNRLQMIIDAWTRITGYTSEWAVSGRELPIGISAIVGSLSQFFPREMV